MDVVVTVTSSGAIPQYPVVKLPFDWQERAWLVKGFWEGAEWKERWEYLLPEDEREAVSDWLYRQNVARRLIEQIRYLTSLPNPDWKEIHRLGEEIPLKTHVSTPSWRGEPIQFLNKLAEVKAMDDVEKAFSNKSDDFRRFIDWNDNEYIHQRRDVAPEALFRMERATQEARFARMSNQTIADLWRRKGLMHPDQVAVIEKEVAVRCGHEIASAIKEANSVEPATVLLKLASREIKNIVGIMYDPDDGLSTIWTRTKKYRIRVVVEGDLVVSFRLEPQANCLDKLTVYGE